MKMKKICTLGLFAVMLFSLSIAAWGSTLGVNVGQGASVSVEKPNTDQDSYKLTGNFGVNDRLLVWLSYNTESEADGVEATPHLGFRYELAKNFAGIFEYCANDTTDTMDIGIRAKTILSKPLTLVGEAKYINYRPKEGDSYSGYSILAQVEYAFTPLVTANLGVRTEGDELEISEAITDYLVGLEFYPTEQFTWWVDYSLDQDSEADTLGIGIEYKF
jgi:hypothetical protein